MTIQITIVGLGQIGASVGLALAGQNQLFRRIGHDRDQETARRAQKMGAIDRVAVNLPSAVREADFVMLCVPPDQLREALEIIAPDLKENAIVVDTSPIKVSMSGWTKELLPEEKCSYVGLVPAINPAYLHHAEIGIDAARADLFQRGLMAIVAPPNSSNDALQAVTKLAGLLGSDPLFVDPYEIDGLLASTHTLPQLMAVALVNATIAQPGWREARKIAGRAYADVSAASALTRPGKALGSMALHNRDNVVRVLDGVIAALQSMRDEIQANDGESLERQLESAQQGHARWVKERQAADWIFDGMPQAVSKSTEGIDFFSRLFGSGIKRKGRD